MALEWLVQHPHYNYIKSVLSEQQLNKLQEIIQAYERGTLQVYNHVYIHNGKVMGINIYDMFYISHNGNYKPIGCEIGVFKWLTVMGVTTDDMLYDLQYCIGKDGCITHLGTSWAKSAELPTVKQLCYARISSVITQDGYCVKQVERAKIIGTITYGTSSLQLNEVLFSGLEGYAYLTYKTPEKTECTVTPIEVREGYAYIKHQNKSVCLSKFK